MPLDSASRSRILLIENDEEGCSALTALLESHGYPVHCASTVAEALAQLDSHPTHVILDLMMPDGCGLIVMQYIKATAPWTRVAILSRWMDPLLEETVQPDLILKGKNDLERLIGWLRGAYEADIGAAVV